MEDEDAPRPPMEFLCREVIRSSMFQWTWRHSMCSAWIVVRHSNEYSKIYSKETKLRWFVSTRVTTILLDQTDFDRLFHFDEPFPIPNHFHKQKESVAKQRNPLLTLSFDPEEVHSQPRTETNLSSPSRKKILTVRMFVADWRSCVTDIWTSSREIRRAREFNVDAKRKHRSEAIVYLMKFCLFCSKKKKTKRIAYEKRSS